MSEYAIFLILSADNRVILLNISLAQIDITKQQPIEATLNFDPQSDLYQFSEAYCLIKDDNIECTCCKNEGTTEQTCESF